MVFSSLEFLFLYLPVVVGLYYLVPAKHLGIRNAVLLVISLFFYGWGEPLYVFLMLFTMLIDWWFGLQIEKKQQSGRSARSLLITATVLNLGILVGFKYTSFLCQNLRLIPGLETLPIPKISLPVGISFYTFQALSYVIDIYRRDCAAQKNPVSFGTYISFFPQLIAGPIVRYQDIETQLQQRHSSVSKLAEGIRTFCCGLGKKVLLANVAGELWEYYRALPTGQRSVAESWLGLLLFSLQIYFDFSGYSDMAIGLGKLFGFHFPENFNYPYIANSITDFWRRWHISLSLWFREYVYIPLGGNRRGTGRMLWNLFIVWLLTGLWHGASWNFVLWGLYYFILLAIEKCGGLRLLEQLPRAFSHICTLFFVAIGWLLFSIEQTKEGLIYLGNLFGVGTPGFLFGNDLYDIVRLLPFLILSIIACTPLPKRLYLHLTARHETLSAWLAGIGCVILLLLSTAYLVDSSYNPFLYFRF